MIEEKIGEILQMNKKRVDVINELELIKSEHASNEKRVKEYTIEGRIRNYVAQIYRNINHSVNLLSGAQTALGSERKTLREIIRDTEPSYQEENFLSEVQNSYSAFCISIQRIKSFNDITTKIFDGLARAYVNIDDVNTRLPELLNRYVNEGEVKRQFIEEGQAKLEKHVQEAEEFLKEDFAIFKEKLASLTQERNELVEKTQKVTVFPVPPKTSNAFGKIELCLGVGRKQIDSKPTTYLVGYKQSIDTGVIGEPFIVNFEKTPNIFIKYLVHEKNSNGVWDFIRSLALNFVLAYPSTIKQIAAVEQPSLNSPFVQMYNLFGKACENGELLFGSKDKTPAITNDKIKATLNEIMNVASGRASLLSGEDILSYNKNNVDNAQPLILLLIKDLVLDEGNAEILRQLLANGSRLGIYIVMMGTEEIWTKNFNMLKEEDFYSFRYGQDASKTLSIVESLKKLTSKYEINIDCYDLNAGVLKKDGYYVELPKNHSVALDPAYYDSMRKVMKASSIIDLVDIITQYNKPREKEYAESLIIPIGKHGSEVATLALDTKGTGAHAIIAGTTGSGKTSLLHSIILSTAYHYSPNEVQFWLMDLKNGGPEFPIYEDLKHVRFLSRDSNKEDIQDLLAYVNWVMTQRNNLISSVGGGDIVGYNRKVDPSKRLPRIIVLIDEYAEVNDSQRSIDELLGIAKKGRSAGISLVLSSQVAEIASITAQCNNKFEFFNERGVFVDNPSQYGDMSKKGACVYVGNGKKYMRIAYAEEDQRREFVKYINNERWGDFEMPKNVKVEKPEIVPYQGQRYNGMAHSNDYMRVLLGEKRFTQEPVIYKVNKNNRLLFLLGDEGRCSQIEEIFVDHFSAIRSSSPTVYYLNFNSDKTLVQKHANRYEGALRVSQKPIDILDIIDEMYSLSRQRIEKLDNGEEIEPIEVIIHGVDEIKELLERISRRRGQISQKSSYSGQTSSDINNMLDLESEEDFVARAALIIRGQEDDQNAYEEDKSNEKDLDAMSKLKSLYRDSQECKMNFVVYFNDTANLIEGIGDFIYELKNQAKDAIITPFIPTDKNDFSESYAEVLNGLRALNLMNDELFSIYEGLQRQAGMQEDQDRNRLKYVVLIDEKIASRYLPMERMEDENV